MKIWAVATYDWEYSQNNAPEGELWKVTVGDWSMPWNFELLKSKYKKAKKSKKSINDNSVQGFDLNYVGVIIGPSVSFKDGKVVFLPENSKNKKAVRNRTFDSENNKPKKQKFGETLLKNELNVLLTRGVKGLYIYAVDPDLQNELLRRQGAK